MEMASSSSPNSGVTAPTAVAEASGPGAPAGVKQVAVDSSMGRPTVRRRAPRGLEGGCRKKPAGGICTGGATAVVTDAELLEALLVASLQPNVELLTKPPQSVDIVKSCWIGLG